MTDGPVEVTVELSRETADAPGDEPRARLAALAADEALMRRSVERYVESNEPVDFGITPRFYCTDPEGNVVELLETA